MDFLLGGIGAVVGGITGKRKTKKIIEDMSIRLTVNDIENPLVIMPLITTKTKTNSKEYKNAEFVAQKVLATLELINKKAEEELSKEDLEKISNIYLEEDDTDPYVEVKKLKELLDLNIITEEEYEIKRKKLLKL